MEHVRLLPGAPSLREAVVAEVADPFARLAAVFALIREADRNPPPSFMPWLVAEYGLGELSHWVPNLYDLVAEGIAWQRIRGTPAAVDMGLSWLGYAAEYELPPAHRRRWHLWQAHLDRVRDAETPDLDRIDGIASLSDDAIGRFWRGFSGYDVRAFEAGGSRWSGAIWSDHSGRRLRDGAAVWSFGRRHEAEHTASEADLTALGTWIEPAPDAGAWVAWDFPWTEMTYPWDVEAVQSRRNTIVAALAGRRWHLAFRDADGDLVGCCRASVRPVREVVGGAYAFGAGSFDPSTSPTALLLWCRTPFAAAPGRTVAAIDLVADAPLAAGVGPGRAWLAPGDIDLDTAAAVISPPALAGLAIPLGITVREHVLCLVRV